MRVLLNTWQPFLPPLVVKPSSDLRLIEAFTAMKSQYSDIEFLRIDDVATAMATNVQYLTLKSLEKARVLKPSHRINRAGLGSAIITAWQANYMPARVLQRLKPDVVLAVSPKPIFPSGCRPPLVVFEALGSDAHHLRAGTTGSLANELKAKKRICRDADVVLAFSPTSAARIERLMPEKRGFIWHVPIYLPYLEPIDEAPVCQKQRAQKLQVLFAGGEARRKGLPLLIEAFERLGESRRRHVELLIVSGFRDGAVEGAERFGRVLGPLPRERVMDLMRRSQIFAFPTTFDSFPRVVIESLAAGCAVVTSNDDPEDWMTDFGRAGLNVDVRSPDAIAGALARLIDDEHFRLETARNGLRRYLSVFHHLAVAARVREALEVARERGRARRAEAATRPFVAHASA